MRTPRITRSMIAQPTCQEEGGGTGKLILVWVCVYLGICTDLATFGSKKTTTCKISHSNIGESQVTLCLHNMFSLYDIA